MALLDLHITREQFTIVELFAGWVPGLTFFRFGSNVTDPFYFSRSSRRKNDFFRSQVTTSHGRYSHTAIFSFFIVARSGAGRGANPGSFDLVYFLIPSLFR
jgi:hypothetical protein